jgi:two-component system LytT family response regulator
MTPPIKAIIIDDEPFAREDLGEMLKSHPGIRIIGEAGSVGEARELLRTATPDLVFLDIQLWGGSGFDLVPDIPAPCHIVFFTAHDRFAVRAFEVNALDYLLKPVTEARLAASIARLEKKKRRPERRPGPAQPLAETDQIYIRTDRERRFVPVSAVVAVVSEGGNYTAVHLEDGRRPLVRETLKQWEALLPESLFRRISRSAIANIRRLRSMEKQADGRFAAGFDGLETPVEVARHHVAHLKKLLEERAGGLGRCEVA